MHSIKTKQPWQQLSNLKLSFFFFPGWCSGGPFSDCGCRTLSSSIKFPKHMQSYFLHPVSWFQQNLGVINE